MVDRVDLAVADLSAQLVCRIAAPAEPCAMLEVGQGRGTKSVLLASCVEGVHPDAIVAVVSVPYKVRLSRRRMEQAGLGDVVSCCELDGCRLGGGDLPPLLDHSFTRVLIDAPCSGTGTLRRHPEIAGSLTPEGVDELADLQLRMLKAASARVALGGSLVYATCSVLRAEDEEVVRAFLDSEDGKGFRVETVASAPACMDNPGLALLVESAQTPDGYLLTTPERGGADGHFCALLQRVG
jgi:16S rRNA (cytosine967-C5)-methyltransferase